MKLSALPTKKIFFILTFLVGIFLLYLSLDYQPLLSQGDHGRDLYCFKKTLDGGIPYKDYWWVYGPLMPFYYALCFKWLGVTILSILFGKSIVLLITLLFFYFALTLFISPALACLGAIWFLLFQDEFFFTYNHVGGILMLVVTIHYLLAYLKKQKIKNLYLSLTATGILMLIKINFGLASLFCLISSVFLIDTCFKNKMDQPKKRFYLISILALPAITFLIYFLFLRELPLYAIRQCLPYLSADHPYHISVVQGALQLTKTIAANISANFINFSLAILILSCLGQTLYLLISKTTARIVKREVLLILTILSLFYIVLLHEFLVSGVLYRSFWARPFSFLLMFFIIGLAIKNSPRLLRLGVYLTILLVITSSCSDRLAFLKNQKNPQHYLSLPRGKIFVGNEPAWVHTVQQTTTFLETHLNKNDKLFSVPYDALYCYLTGNDSPTRQLIFFDHINIPKEQEQIVIDELETQNVNWIVLSNRSKSDEEGLGIFGQTYCPLIRKYIAKNFETVATFGEWNRPAGWAWNHAVKILKRKTAQ